MSRMKRYSRSNRLAILLTCVAIWVAALVATHTPARKLPSVTWSDKTIHCIGYFVLAWTFWLTLRAHGLGGWRRPAWVLAVMTAYAALDEATQPLPLFGRHASFLDWTADVIGVVALLIVAEAMVWILSPRRRPGDW